VLKIFLVILAATTAFAADDPWQKVKDLKAGADLRVFRKGSTQPLLVQMGELTDDNLVVVDKKAERAIPREEIDRIDSRPPKTTWVKEEKTSNTPNADGSNSSSYSSGYSKGSRGDFETIYRRPAPPPKK
jgi:hypothetical protein